MATNIQAHDLGISTIDTGFMREKFAACHLLQQKEQAVLIDVASSVCAGRILQVLRNRSISPEQISHIIVTHVHLDHAGGAGLLLQHCPNAKLVVHPRGSRHLIDPSRLMAGTKEVYGEEAFAKYHGEVQPVAAERVIEAADGFKLDIAGRELVFIDTPGHAKHHFCVWDEYSMSFFTGDTFGIAYQEFMTARGRLLFASTTPIQFDPPALVASIEKLLTYHPQQMFLTHYGKLEQVETAAKQLLQSIEQQVALARSCVYTDERRQLELEARLMEYFLSELAEIDCQLSVEQSRALLAADVALNAQGLLFWLNNN
jgi:glyoxylase-like metal-dependent hydrolase (beta-lactamase superfamily II)